MSQASMNVYLVGRDNGLKPTVVHLQFHEDFSMYTDEHGDCRFGPNTPKVDIVKYTVKPGEFDA